MYTARQLACPSPGVISWREIELPEPGEGEVLVRPEFGVEKHGTMAAFVKGYANDRGGWDWNRRIHVEGGELWPYPVPLGNMQFGQLADGRRVAWQGPFQDVVVVREADLYDLGDVDWRDAAMFDPGTFAFAAVRGGGVRIGDDVAVFGLGAIGLSVVQLALVAGAQRVFAVDPIEERRAIAERFGAIAISGDDPGLALREATDGRGVDVSVDFSGSWRALQAAFRGTGVAGTIAYGAFPAPFPAGLDLGAEAHYNRHRLIFTGNAAEPDPDHPRWNDPRLIATVWDLIVGGRLRGRGIVDEPIPFADLDRVYPDIAANPGAHLKLSTEYPR
jgi:threonine dehydrogenase-like Zn-dependent dehydrogenase